MDIIFLGSKKIKNKNDKELFLVYLGKGIENGYESFSAFTNKETFEKISKSKPFSAVDNLAVFFNHNQSGCNNVYYRK